MGIFGKPDRTQARPTPRRRRRGRSRRLRRRSSRRRAAAPAPRARPCVIGAKTDGQGRDHRRRGRARRGHRRGPDPHHPRPAGGRRRRRCKATVEATVVIVSGEVRRRLHGRRARRDPGHRAAHRQHPRPQDRDRGRRDVPRQQRHVRRGKDDAGRDKVAGLVSATRPRGGRPRRGSARRAATYGNYIDGEWVPAASGKTFENRNPADRDDLIGAFADSGPEDVEKAVAAAREAFPRWQRRARAQARRDPLPRRRDPGAAQGGVLARHDARDGQGPGRDPRRRPGSHRHDVLHGRRGPPPVRPDDAVRAAPTSSRCRCACRWASPG